jgi:hypothetical protein
MFQNDSRKLTVFSDLPAPAVETIFNYLPTPDLMSFSKVNKYYNKSHMIAIFPNHFSNLPT